MFTNQELHSISTRYFLVLEATPLYVRIQSRCTKHFWRIYAAGVSGNKKCIIQHTHTAYSSFHDHGKEDNLKESITSIMRHDRYQLSHRRAEPHPWDEYKPMPTAKLIR